MSLSSQTSVDEPFLIPSMLRGRSYKYRFLCLMRVQADIGKSVRSRQNHSIPPDTLLGSLGVLGKGLREHLLMSMCLNLNSLNSQRKHRMNGRFCVMVEGIMFGLDCAHKV
jgi:hypothetical protein